MQARLTRQLKEARAEWRAAKEESKALQAQLVTSHKQVACLLYCLPQKQQSVLLSVCIMGCQHVLSVQQDKTVQSVCSTLTVSQYGPMVVHIGSHCSYTWSFLKLHAMSQSASDESERTESLSPNALTNTLPLCS